MNTKRFFLLAMLMCFISVCAHAQLILLEEDESGVVETVQQAVTPQVQSVATPAPQPAPQQQQIVAEEEEENLFAPKQQAQPAKSSKAKAEPKPKAEKAPKQKAEKAPKAEPAQQPKKQQGLVMEEEEDDAAAKAKAEAERKAAEEAARVEAERKAAEEAAKAEAERKAAEEAARLEAERKAAEEAARVEAERKAAEAAAAAEAARLEAERKAAEEAAAAEAARQEAERLAAEEAAKAEAERLAAEEAAKAAVVVPVVAPVLVEEQTAPQSSEALKAAEMQAKLDSVLRVQREQEEQLRLLQEQKQAVQTERDREDAALMERARQEAEARAKAKAEAERRAQLEEERRFNDQQVVANEEPKEKKKETIFTRYYKHNGQNMLSFLSFGYSTVFVLDRKMVLSDGSLIGTTADMVFKRHMLSFEAFEWRAKCFGMQLFNFEMGLNTDQYFNGPLYGGANADPKTQTIVNDIQPADAKTMWFAYKPAIKFYIPCTKWMAIELYGGMEVDLCAVWSKINQSYYPVNSLIPAQNFFLSGFGGLGLMFTPTPYVPMELKAEYRHPVKGNTAIVPQGVYLSLQIHLATPTKKR